MVVLNETPRVGVGVRNKDAYWIWAARARRGGGMRATQRRAAGARHGAEMRYIAAIYRDAKQCAKIVSVALVRKALQVAKI